MIARPTADGFGRGTAEADVWAAVAHYATDVANSGACRNVSEECFRRHIQIYPEHMKTVSRYTMMPTIPDPPKWGEPPTSGPVPAKMSKEQMQRLGNKSGHYCGRRFLSFEAG